MASFSNNFGQKKSEIANERKGEYVESPKKSRVKFQDEDKQEFVEEEDCSDIPQSSIRFRMKEKSIDMPKWAVEEYGSIVKVNQQPVFSNNWAHSVGGKSAGSKNATYLRKVIYFACLTLVKMYQIWMAEEVTMQGIELKLCNAQKDREDALVSE